MSAVSSVGSSVGSSVAASVTVGSGGGIDVDVTNFITAAGITDGTQIDALQSLVTSWKNIGMWQRTVAIYPFVGGTADSHKYNLIDPRDADEANRLSFSGTITHSANGADPDGSTGLANTFIDLNLQVPQYSLSFGYYSRENTTPSADEFLMGQNTMWFDVYSTNRIDVSLMQTVYATGATTSTNFTGTTDFNKLLGFSQNGPSSTSIYQAKNRRTHNTTEVRGYWSNSGTITNRQIGLFGGRGSGLPGWAGKTARECAFAFFAWGVDQPTWNLIVDIVDEFQLTLGRNV